MPDVAAAGAGGIFTLVGLGDGTFEPAQKLAAPAGLRSVAGDDVDLDGTTDLVLAGGANQVFVGLNDGEGTFAEFAAYTVGGTPAQVAIADVDDDGLLDLLTANRGSDDISILTGAGRRQVPGAVPGQGRRHAHRPERRRPGRGRERTTS